MYKSANAGECPLVVDTTTSSCGNSRFGCWVCTVVEKDKSMEALVDNGEEWLLPLLEFRDLLAETQDPAKKHLFRDYRRLDGKVWKTTSGDIVRGPYRLDTCKDFLGRLLKIQTKIQNTKKGLSSFSLISMEELQEIRRIWRTQRQDWEDSVPRIFQEATGEECRWLRDDAPVYRENDSHLLEEACKEAEVPTELVAKLLDMERDLHGMLRRSTVMTRMDKILRQDWDSEEDVIRRLAEEKRQRGGESQ
jgi:DNA sulfur modification protein DndC